MQKNISKGKVTISSSKPELEKKNAQLITKWCNIVGLAVTCQEGNII